jgi:DNA-binding MarR family transcriptional regulator
VTTYTFEVHLNIGTELKVTKPFTSAAQEVMLTLARTAAVIEHRFEEVLREHDVTATQFNVLRMLRGAGADGLCRNEIGERMVRRVPDVTRLLDRLEACQFIVRERIGEDRRFVTTRITKEGLALLTRVDPSVRAFEEEAVRHMSQKRLDALIDQLNELRSGVASARSGLSATKNTTDSTRR